MRVTKKQCEETLRQFPQCCFFFVPFVPFVSFVVKFFSKL
jgi:hypothetical protein